MRPTHVRSPGLFRCWGRFGCNSSHPPTALRCGWRVGHTKPLVAFFTQTELRDQLAAPGRFEMPNAFCLVHPQRDAQAAPAQGGQGHRSWSLSAASPPAAPEGAGASDTSSPDAAGGSSLTGGSITEQVPGQTCPHPPTSGKRRCSRPLGQRRWCHRYRCVSGRSGAMTPPLELEDSGELSRGGSRLGALKPGWTRVFLSDT